MKKHCILLNSQLNYSFHYSVLLEENCLPTLESILEMQQKKDCFFLFCDTFLSRIFGFKFLEGQLCNNEMAMVSDETFAYLLIENY